MKCEEPTTDIGVIFGMIICGIFGAFLFGPVGLIVFAILGMMLGDKVEEVIIKYYKHKIGDLNE